jgi:hypothetical protein
MRGRWTRVGFYYYAETDVYRTRPGFKIKIGSLSKRLHFVSYHLIKLFHGQAYLDKMALNTEWVKEIFK